MRPAPQISLREAVLAVAILLGTVVALVVLLPTVVVVLGAVIVVLATTVYAAAFLVVAHRRRLPTWLQRVPIWAMLLVPVGIALLLIDQYHIVFSPVNGLIFVSLLLLICVYWLVIPTALAQHFRTRREEVSIEAWPSVTSWCRRTTRPATSVPVSIQS